MLNDLLKIINFEDLIFFFKEKSLTNDIKYNINHLSINSKNIETISDSDILKIVLPKEIYSLMFSSGQLTLLAFVFALRHKLLTLNALFHLSALESNQSSLLDETKKNFYELFGNNFLEQYNSLFKFLSPQFWGKFKQLPIFGFSSVGCHFVMRDITYCRAFDIYDLTFCNNLSQDIFCKKHIVENFWSLSFSDESSVQAKLSKFYLDPKNFSEFNEESLNKLLENFFDNIYKFQKKHIKIQHNYKKINLLLNFYNFSSIEDLKMKGYLELRRRFMEMAKNYHPDIGGSNELFREARENYEYLREILINE